MLINAFHYLENVTVARCPEDVPDHGCLVGLLYANARREECIWFEVFQNEDTPEPAMWFYSSRLRGGYRLIYWSELPDMRCLVFTSKSGKVLDLMMTDKRFQRIILEQIALPLNHNQLFYTPFLLPKVKVRYAPQLPALPL